MTTPFSLAVKSTLDYRLNALAVEKSLVFLDMDGSYAQSDQAGSDKPALSITLSSLAEAPRDPFWFLQFEAGALTTNDPAQYASMEIQAWVQELFRVGSAIPIVDYSQPVAGADVLGEMYIVASVSAPATFDKVVGFRPVQISAHVQRFWR